MIRRWRGLSFVLTGRAALTAVCLGGLLAVTVAMSVSLGVTDVPISALFGIGTGGEVLLMQEIRLPRVVAGLLTGAALGAAGCLTQTLARNKLATPDVLGIGEGATFAVLLTLLGTTTGVIGAWWVGPAGAIGAAVVVVLLASSIHSGRLVIVGVAVSTVLSSLAELAMSTQNLAHATALYTWTIGSLTGRGYPAALGIGLAVLLPLALLLGQRLAILRFDTELARTLGVDVGRVGLAILAIAVVLAGLGTGIGGPIAFVALSAPVLAGWLAGPERVPVLGSALAGAILVVAADALGRLAGDLPVGVVSSLLGGPFLLWMLLQENR